MNIRFAAIADSEYKAARGHYSRISPIIEEAFVQSVRAALNLILRFPKIGHEIEPGIRRKIIHRFPYAIFYSVIHDLILIIGIFDLRREPEIWQYRVGFS